MVPDVIPHATEADFLNTWGDRPDPDNMAALLSYASLLVDHETRHAVYPTVRGRPVLWAADAFKSATVAQAIWWAENGLNPASGELGDVSALPVASKTIRGASVSFDGAAAAEARAARRAALVELCPAAWAMLTRVGLVGGSGVWYNV